MYLDTSDDGKGNREQESIGEGLDWSEYGDVFDQRVIPEKSEDQGANQDGKHDNQDFSNGICSAFNFHKVFNHFIVYVYFFLP